MAKHTPTPWRESRGFISSDENGYVPLITPFREDAHREMHGNPTTEAQANAEFIVRACNAHDGLLAACKALCGVFEGQEDVPQYVLKARAAIAKASLP